MKELKIPDSLIESAFSKFDFGPQVETLKQKKLFLAKQVFAHASGYVGGSSLREIMRKIGLLPYLTHSNIPSREACRWAYKIIIPELSEINKENNEKIPKNSSKNSKEKPNQPQKQTLRPSS